jgi:magnesium-protoporphyrin IX monomethyl ester (oxidative) cyclase
MGLSAVKAALNQAEIPAEVSYLNIEFAAEMGLSLCEWISVDSPVNLLLGEWIFAHLIRSDLPGLQHNPNYLDEVRDRFLAGVLPPTDAFERARAGAGPFLDAAADRIVAAKPRIVGLASSFQQSCAGLALALRIKQRDPDILICMGGANCDAPMGPGLLRAFAQLDYVFSGESDLSFPAFVAAYLAGQRAPADQPGVFRLERLADNRGVVLADPVMALDALGVPDMDDFFTTLRASGLGDDSVRPGLVLESSRGCWWGAKKHCRFCGLNAMGMAYRSKSPARLLAEIEFLSARYGIYGFQAVDNILDLRHIPAVFDVVAGRPDPYTFFYEVKANLRHEQLVRMAKAGISHVQPGIESLSDRVLELMEKGVSALQNIAFIRSCVEIGIQPFWNILYRFPGETNACYDEMRELFPLIQHLPPPASACAVRLDRYSPYFERAAELGYHDLTPFPAYAKVFGLDADASAEIAYYFEGTASEVADRPTMRAFLAALHQWKAAHEGPELGNSQLRPTSEVPVDDGAQAPMLALVEDQEQGLGVVIDTRSVALERFTKLDAASIEVLREFRHPRPLRSASRDDAAYAAIVAMLVERRFLVVIGERAVSVVCELTWCVFGGDRDAPEFPGGRVKRAGRGRGWAGIDWNGELGESAAPADPRS